MAGGLENLAFDSKYYPAAFLTCAFFLFVFKFISPSLSAKLCPGFKALSEDKQIDWHSRVNSSIHAVIVTSTCVYAFVYDDGVSDDPIWTDSPVVRTSCSIVVGYLTSDAILMVVYFKQIGALSYFFHHGASIYAYYFVMTYGVLPYFANYRLLAEFSTPFINNRWFLDVLGYSKSSTIFMGNGIAMTASFFLARIFTLPHYWFKIYSIYGTESFIRLGHIQMVLVVSCFVLDLINLYWFYKMCRGVHKVVKIYNVDKNKNITEEKSQ